MFDGLANYINEVVRGKKIRVAGRDAQWRKVADIKVGTKIAVVSKNTKYEIRSPKQIQNSNLENSNIVSDFEIRDSDFDVEWDEIVSIKRLSPERVYDIEVEDTHNFVGNGILAHNTYAAIFNGGNVGIGTTAPSQKLDVNGAVRADYFVDSSSTSYGIDPAGTGSFTLTNNGLRLAYGATFAETAGNVGIGTTGPSEKLTINGKLAFTQTAGDETNAGKIDYRGFDSTALNIVGAGTAGNNRLIRFYDFVGVGVAPVSGIAMALYGDANASSTTYSAWGSSVLRFKQAASEDANAGSLSYKLVDSTALSILGSGTSGINRLVRIFDRLGINTAASTAQTLNVDGSGSTYAAIFQNGNVGIGTTNPNASLQIIGPNSASGNAQTVLSITGGAGVDAAGGTGGNGGPISLISGNGGGGGVGGTGGNGGNSTLSGGDGGTGTGAGGNGGAVYIYGGLGQTPTGKGGNVLLAIDSGGTARGNVGIGTTAPGYLLTVNSSTPGCNGCTLWTNYSDIRLKNNIASLSGGILDKIMELNPVTFNYNDTYYSKTGYSRPDGTTPTYTGFIAQDLRQIFPEMVSTAGSGYLDTNLSNLQIYLVKAIQEQQGEIIKLNTITLDPHGNVIVDNTTGSVYDGHPDNQYSLQDSVGNIITTAGSFAQATIANLRAGYVQAEHASLITLTSLTSHISQLFVDRLTVREKIISPVVETTDLVATGTATLNTVATNEIKPQFGDLTIDLSSPTPLISPISPITPTSPDKGLLARLIIKGLEGKTAAVIDEAGNATFSGTLTSLISLTSPNLTVGNASVSGTLIAGNVQSDNINSLTRELANSKTDINDVQKLLADIKNAPLPDTTNTTNLSSISPLSSPTSLTSPTSPTALTDLTVSGNSNLYNLSVSGSLLVGTTMFENNSILSLASDLKFSSLGTITLFDGQVVIAKNGNITTQGTIIAEGGIQIRNSKFEIRNSENNEVASIDASGSAKFNQLTTNQLTINDKYLDATQSGAIIAAADNFAQNGINAPAIETATASAGIGILPSNQQEVVIYNSLITPTSLIYLTPTSPISPTSFTPNGAAGGVGQLTVSQKVTGAKPYFKVTTSIPTTTPMQFNWLIIN